MLVLLIEADPLSGTRLAESMGRTGFIPRRASSVKHAQREGWLDEAAVILFDAGLTEGQAGQTVRNLRAAGADQPLIVLSARGDWREKVDCLDAGSDDYLQKPVRSEEIAARFRVIIRRCAGSSTDRVVSGDLALDLKARCAWRQGKCLNLTRSEFRLLRLFMLTPERIVTGREIWHELHPAGVEYSANAIEVQVARLRQKIGRERIRTTRGAGYRMIPEAPATAQAAMGVEPCIGGERRQAREARERAENFCGANI